MNSNAHLLQRLYLNTSGKYLKFKQRLDKAVSNGRFYKLPKRKQSSLVSRLRKLFERLRSLQAQLRIAGAGAALALTLSVSSSLKAQSSLGPFERNDQTNPLPPPVVLEDPRPAIVDIDNDGDLDVFIGDSYGDIRFFRNVSPEDEVSRFVEVTGTSNPLNGVNKGFHAAPAFADVDGDGDYDMLLGVLKPYYNPPGGPNQYDYSPTYFFRNTGTATNPVFTQQTGSSNPFDGIYGSKYGPSIPTFVNLDGDGDIDLFIGSSFSSDLYGPNPGAQYFQNQGTAAAPNFVFTPHSLSYLYFGNAAITFVDVDGDLGLDAVIGSNGGVRTFIQGSEMQFTEVYGSQNPFSGFYFGNHSSPVAADFDGDGDMDFLVGSSSWTYNDNSNIRYFENDGFNLDDKTQLNASPFGGVDVGEDAAPVFVDVDGDGDLDAVIGAKYSDETAVYINEEGLFFADQNNPIYEILDEFNYDIIPVFVDIDNDGDQDMFVCEDNDVYFYRNNGGSFDYETSPLVLGSANDVSLAFIDVDNDGDFDALLGNDQYAGPKVLYFQNTGTPSSPVFVSATPPAPFDNSNIFEDDPNIVSVDLDNDGDLDLVATETYYNGWYGDSDAARTWFYENNGDGTFTESEEPIMIELTPESITSFADADGDGDLDAFVGNGYSFNFDQDGRVFFFENTNPPPVTNVISSVLVVVGGNPTVLDPTLTIDDPDDDDISSATVSISDFVPGEEELDFTAENGIEGTFDDETGVLTFIGRASVETYEDLLRTVTINFTGTVPGSRRSSSGHALDLAQEVTFQVRDVDFTLTTVSVVSLNIVPFAEIDIYNAMSPNSDDNLNPYFKIEHIETVSPENKVTIYNRWGDVVFEVADYNNSVEGKRFNGVSDKGKDLPSGTYFYKIELASKTITGYLSLKR